MVGRLAEGERALVQILIAAESSLSVAADDHEGLVIRMCSPL